MRRRAVLDFLALRCSDGRHISRLYQDASGSFFGNHLTALSVIAPVDRDIAMQNFLKDFRVRNESNALAQQTLEDSLRINFVPVRGPTRYIGMFESTKIIDDRTP